MRIHISAPQVDVTINDSDGNGIFQYHAKDYVLSFDIARAIQEAGSLAQLIDSIDEKVGEQVNVADTLMDAAREVERAEQAAKDAPADPDAVEWRVRKNNWFTDSAPVAVSLHERVDLMLRGGDEHLGVMPSKWDWSINQDDPDENDIVAWRPTQ